MILNEFYRSYNPPAILSQYFVSLQTHLFVD